MASILCLSMGALWGGCDDASGPVLVRVMTNGFRTLRSLPLGGAIPSAASPEAADTLEHKESVQETAPSAVVFASCDLQTCCHHTVSASARRNTPDHPSARSALPQLSELDQFLVRPHASVALPHSCVVSC